MSTNLELSLRRGKLNCTGPAGSKVEEPHGQRVSGVDLPPTLD